MGHQDNEETEMNILIDIGHPAHVHLFRCFAHDMMEVGHKVLFTCRDKEFEIALLEAEGFEYDCFGKKYKSTAGKLWGLLKFDWNFNYSVFENPYKGAYEFSPYKLNMAPEPRAVDGRTSRSRIHTILNRSDCMSLLRRRS